MADDGGAYELSAPEDRELVRGTLLQLARDLVYADDRGTAIVVIASVDEYVERLLGAK